MKRTIYFTAACLMASAAACNKTETITVLSRSMKVIEYSPAPGQFINDGFSCSTMDEAAAWAQDRLDKGLFVSLGAFGGNLVVEVTPAVENKDGYDFGITGNSFDGGSEPGIVWVSEDGAAWYQLNGQEDETRNWSVTYYRPENGEPADIRWKDCEGNEGVIRHLPQFHDNPYFPSWIKEAEYTLAGTRISDRSFTGENGLWNSGRYGPGYADNWAEDMEDMSSCTPNRFDISDAVGNDGKPVKIGQVKFIKVQTAVITANPSSATGEISTEVLGISCY